MTAVTDCDSRSVRDSGLPQPLEQRANRGRVELACRLDTRQDQVEQFIVGLIKQMMQAQHVLVSEIGLVPVQKTGQHEIIFEQTASRSPPKPPTPSRIVLMCQ
jgi:hypothetical protein